MALSGRRDRITSFVSGRKRDGVKSEDEVLDLLLLYLSK